MSFNEKPGMYVFEKKTLVNKVPSLTMVLYFHRIFYLLWQKKIMPFFLFENIFAKKLGFNENPGMYVFEKKK